MQSRVETLLNAIINGETIEGFEPQSRSEAYLLAAVTKSGVADLPTPQSRLDALLYKLADMMPESYGADYEAGKRDFLAARNGSYLFYKWAGSTAPLEYDDTSKMTDMSYMFYNSTSLEQAPMVNTDKVTNMYYMFYGCSALNSVPQYNTKNVSNMGYLFYGCKLLEEFPNLETKNVTSMKNMFASCSAMKNVPSLDTSNVTDMTSMFASCISLEEAPSLNTSNVTLMGSMFSGCTALKHAPNMDTSKVTSMAYMFNGCKLLESAPDYDYSNVDSMEQMYYNCSKITSFKIDGLTKNVSLKQILYGCTSLTDVEILNVPLVYNISYGMQGCSNLKTAKFSNTQTFNQCQQLFHSCAKLESVTGLDLRNAIQASTSLYNTFYNCKALTNLDIKNIKLSLQVGNASTWGHLLTVDSLIKVIYECINTGSALTLTVGTANLAKLSNVYVKLIDVTDEMRAADEFVDSKHPFEVCESTDEGAMLITSYAADIKNWTIK